MKNSIEPYGYIYLTTNKINGKRYVGQHSHSKLDKRYYGSGILISKALKKYGKENFKVQILEYCYSKKDLNDRERYWIEKLKTLIDFGCYNLDKAPTGIGRLTKKRKMKNSLAWKNLSDDERLKRKEKWINAQKKSFADPIIGKRRRERQIEISTNRKHSDETKKMISEKRKKIKRTKEQNKQTSIAMKKYYSNHDGTFLNKTHTKETKIKISESRKKSLKVKCEYCGKELDNSHYCKYHGERCLENPNLTEDEIKILKDKRQPKNALKKAIIKNTGSKRSIETKEILSQKAKNRKKMACEYCGKVIQPSAYFKWHGKNCKLFKNV